MIKSFEPIFDENCKLLILGSCPSEKSLQKGEYYGHHQNRFWRVIFKLTGEDFTADYQTKKQILLKHGVALWDTIGRCHREGSLDSAITGVVPNDIERLVKCGNIQCIALNGGKAKQVFLQRYKQFLTKENLLVDRKYGAMHKEKYDGDNTVHKEKHCGNKIGQSEKNAKENYFFAAGNKRIKLVFLPSTSPANARMNLETLYQTWYENLKDFL